MLTTNILEGKKALEPTVNWLSFTANFQPRSRTLWIIKFTQYL